MTDTTLEHPDSDTTITFDVVSTIRPSRGMSRVFEMGDLEGNGIVESAGISILKVKVSYDFIDDQSKSAFEKWDEFDSLIQDHNEEQMTLTWYIDTSLGNKKIAMQGKVTGGPVSDMKMGLPQENSGSFVFTVESKGAVEAE